MIEQLEQISQTLERAIERTKATTEKYQKFCDEQNARFTEQIKRNDEFIAQLRGM